MNYSKQCNFTDEVKKMRKYFIIFLSLMFISANVFAERQLFGTAGLFSMMQDGTKGNIAYFAGGTYPIIQKKIPRIIVYGVDTLMIEDDSSKANYELLARVGYLYVDQETAKGFSQTQAQMITLLNRKSLGWKSSFVDLGSTYSNVNNSEGDDEQVFGIYFGGGIKVLNNIKLEVGVHIFNTPEDKPTKYAPGLAFDIGL